MHRRNLNIANSLREKVGGILAVAAVIFVTGLIMASFSAILLGLFYWLSNL